MFSFEDTRYNRQKVMPSWEGKQERLDEAQVGVIGAGGVKSTLLMALAAAGVGTIHIFDFDRVELSNLNRQTLYSTDDIGEHKAARAADRLGRLNSDISVNYTIDKIEQHNIDNYLGGYDFIVEGGDSPAGRNLVNEYCLHKSKPYVHASAQFSYGYTFSVVPDWETACFACFFPDDHQREQSTGPVPVNVLSVSLAGTLGANEVIKWFLGYKDNMIVNERLCFSSLLLSEDFEYLNQPRREDCPVCSRFYG